MKYLFVVFLIAGIISCQNPSEELIRQNEVLRAQANKAAITATQARADAELAAEDAKIAQVRAIRAQEDAQQSLEMALLAQATAQEAKAYADEQVKLANDALEKCKSGK